MNTIESWTDKKRNSYDEVYLNNERQQWVVHQLDDEFYLY